MGAGGGALCGFVLSTTGATTEQISINFPVHSELGAALVGMAIFTTVKNLEALLSPQSRVCNSGAGGISLF